MNGIYWFFIICLGVSLLFIKLVVPWAAKPAQAEADEAGEGKASQIPKHIPWLCLAAIFATYVNIGAYWTYIELASLSDGVPDEWIGEVLVWASLLSVVGCAFATVISNRLGLARPLIGALVTMTLIVGMLAFGITSMNIIVSVFMFNFLWIFIDVYQMSTVALIDPRGTFSSLIVGAQGLGQIVGPNIAGTILGDGLGYSTVFIMCAIAASTGMVIYIIMYSQLRKLAPDILHTG